MGDSLNLRQQKFIQEYSSNGGNATKAAQAAGYGNGDNYSRLAGHRLLTNDNVHRKIQELSEAKGLSIDRIMTRLARIIENGRDSDAIQAIKVWGDLAGAFAPKSMRLIQDVMNAPKSPEEIDNMIAKMKANMPT